MDDSWRIVLIMGTILLLKHAGQIILRKYPRISHIWSGEQQRKQLVDGLADGTIHRLPRGTYKRVRSQEGLSEYVKSSSSWIRWSDGDYYLKRPAETVSVNWNRVQFSVEPVSVRIDLRHHSISDRESEYQSYLSSPEWRALRKEALANAGHRCQVCNSPKALQVHHRTYKNIFHEEPEDLTVLCRDCHALFHQGGRITKRH
jgi:hypothetical protein